MEGEKGELKGGEGGGKGPCYSVVGRGRGVAGS